MSKARGLADLGNAYSDGALSNRNVLINGSFLVSQRGDYTSATSVSDNNYYLDRWKVWSAVSANLEQFVTNQPNNSLLTKSARLTATASATSDLRLAQPVEFPTRYGGQTMTLSAWIKTNSANCRMYFFNDAYSASTESAAVPNDEEWHYTTLTITVASGLSNFIPIIGIDGPLSAQVSISSGDYFEITGVQLEVGDTATPFEHRSYGDELALCQRYYQKSYQQDVAPSDSYVSGVEGPLAAFSANTAYATTMQYPVVMRTNPTITFYANAGTSSVAGKWAYYNGSWNAVDSIGVSAIRDRWFTPSLTKTSGFTAQNVYLFSGNYVLDAEL